MERSALRSSPEPLGTETFTDLGHSMKAFALAGMMMAPFVLGWGAFMYEEWREERDAREAAIWASQAYERVVSGPAGDLVAVGAATHGREVFMTTCAACHGADGRGLPKMGRNLVESDFIANRDDGAMKEFLLVGRMDAQPMPMPAKGGREDLTDADLADVVVYLRGVQDPRRMPALAAYVPPAPAPVTEADKAAALQAAGGDAELAQYIANGTKLFNSTCIACHGKGGVGINGNGKTLVNNEFIKSLDDDALLTFVKGGRAPTDPKNTTGIQMPPKGGNPALSEDDLLDIIAYLRTLQPKGAGAVTQAK